MFITILIIVIILYLIFRAYIKINYPFWSIQPVFHFYDIHHWLRSGHIIDKTLPKINEYVNIINIRTQPIGDMLDNEIEEACQFIKKNYFNGYYKPETKHTVEYLKGSNRQSLIGVYKNGEKIYSVVTARIVHITINSTTFPSYYVDNLCVDPSMKKKGIAQKTIQTMVYEIRHRNHDVYTGIFKREGNMTAITPLTMFRCKGYLVSDIIQISLPHASMNVIEISCENLRLFTDFIYAQKNKYKCFVLPEITNIANVIKAGVISIFGILENDSLIAIYIFRDAAHRSIYTVHC